jgi:hypothetical protein
MFPNTKPPTNESRAPEKEPPSQPRQYKLRPIVFQALFTLIIFATGLSSGYFLGKRHGKTTSTTADSPGQDKAITLAQQVNPTEGYTMPVRYGDIGPLMVAAGAIDLDKFIQVYQQASSPLTDEQIVILSKGSDTRIVIDHGNAYFLLNFFWAFGLTNQNSVLTEGPMMASGKSQVGNFASTGGWTIGARSPTELFASTLMVALTKEQQDRLVAVASAVYRPCCNNPTSFPDCNHGMAMLGLLELMASQNATTDEMFTAAKFVNAFWFPQQMLEVATVLKTTQNVDFAQIDPRQAVSNQFLSASGFQNVHQWLASNGLLDQNPNSGGSCGVQ